MTQHTGILLSTAYFAPISYFSKLAAYPEIYIEQHENFIKQTYRNRTVILGANGPIPLIVPVEKGRERKIKIKDLRIAYDEDWQRNHWRTIFSAYNSSPFFEYYADDLEHFFRKKHKFLFDFNQQITESLLEILEMPTNLILTEGFEQIPENCLNFREKISPKAQRNIDDPHFEAQYYTQVFSEKFGFVPDLSILDLLFNEGPSTHSVLLNGVQKA
ncbi:MAG TPA: WbqC family protein [Prolixibacteraceae bacterium]|nr:WbqC family protein [Prolixibacteraceae bacterium]